MDFERNASRDWRGENIQIRPFSSMQSQMTLEAL
jgi:hypothetical protein